MRTPRCPIRMTRVAGEGVCGVALQIPAQEIAEIIGYVDLDAIWVDATHGTMDLRATRSRLLTSRA
jgi:2-keto-3-deoxy-L-rhamnonate aldolase RhmA